MEPNISNQIGNACRYKFSVSKLTRIKRTLQEGWRKENNSVNSYEKKLDQESSKKVINKL